MESLSVNTKDHMRRLQTAQQEVKIHITKKTSDYLKGQFHLTQRGEVELKGKGKWSTYFLTD